MQDRTTNVKEGSSDEISLARLKDHEIRRALLTRKCSGDGSGAAAVGDSLRDSSGVGRGLGAPGGASGGDGVAGGICRCLDNSLGQGLRHSLGFRSVGLGNGLASSLGLTAPRRDGSSQRLSREGS